MTNSYNPRHRITISRINGGVQLAGKAMFPMALTSHEARHALPSTLCYMAGHDPALRVAIEDMSLLIGEVCVEVSAPAAKYDSLYSHMKIIEAAYNLVISEREGRQVIMPGEVCDAAKDNPARIDIPFDVRNSRTIN